MLSSQAAHRRLFERISNLEGRDRNALFLSSWLRKHRDEAAWVGELSAFGRDDWLNLAGETPFRLYSLGRVCQLLQLALQIDRPDVGRQSAPDVDAEMIVGFFTALGMQALPGQPFDPFHHEIHQVTIGDVGEIHVTAERSPPLMIGAALFSRGLVDVVGPASMLDAEAAETSKIYWSHQRRNRPSEDPSFGWGSNSQWRTSARIDIEIDGVRSLNVLGSHDIDGEFEKDPFTAEQRLEILTHRHAVTRATFEVFQSGAPWVDRYRLIR